MSWLKTNRTGLIPPNNFMLAAVFIVAIVILSFSGKEGAHLTERERLQLGVTYEFRPRDVFSRIPVGRRSYYAFPVNGMVPCSTKGIRRFKVSDEKGKAASIVITVLETDGSSGTCEGDIYLGPSEEKTLLNRSRVANSQN